ncbi:MAG: putative zinc finger protein [Streblomastix strix]|uniref:Putative zinc finger protein n=1 Tax=Streblomastix strix TaxID=222440 RepID=A0A5J4VD90_9EUKA|nr:MAG: putative zinc finger protein [Streblomastix strix]
MFKKRTQSTSLQKHTVPTVSEKSNDDTLICYDIEKLPKKSNLGLKIVDINDQKLEVKVKQQETEAKQTELDEEERLKMLDVDDPNLKNKRAQLGPIKASKHIRITSRFDYQPDICKDYYETGYCTFGDACKFMHTREDFKTGWQIEQDWEKKQKEMKNKNIHKMSDDDEDDDEYRTQPKKRKREVDDQSDDDASDSIFPFACMICRKNFVDPVVTICQHFFCSSCALTHYGKSQTCSVCGHATNGIFNTAFELLSKKEIARRNHIWSQRDNKKPRLEEDSNVQIIKKN